MPLNCSCGALLPEDAQFCHRCGRPLFDEPVTAVEAPPPLPPPPPLPVVAKPLKIGLHNSTAVRVALLAACLTTALSSIQLPTLIQLLWNFVLLVGGGFLTVYLYQRRTGEFLNVSSGARIGWLTGFFHFLIALVLFTLAMLALDGQGGVAQLFRKAIETNSSPELRGQMESILANPSGLGFLIFGTLVFSFCVLSILTAAGGALGAKVLEKEN